MTDPLQKTVGWPPFMRPGDRLDRNPVGVVADAPQNTAHHYLGLKLVHLRFGGGMSRGNILFPARLRQFKNCILDNTLLAGMALFEQAFVDPLGRMALRQVSDAQPSEFD
jgi:hypothetical protein